MVSVFIQNVIICALCGMIVFIVGVRLMIKFKMNPVEHIAGSFHQISHAAYFYRSKIVHLAGFHVGGSADALLKKTIDHCVQMIIQKTKEAQKFHIEEISTESIRMHFDAMTLQVDRQYVEYFRISLGKAYAHFMNETLFKELAGGLDSFHRSEEELLRAYEYFSMLLHIGVENHVQFSIMRLQQISAGMYNLILLKRILRNSDEHPGKIDIAQVQSMLKFPPNMVSDNVVVGIAESGSVALKEVLDRVLVKI